jgi:hypothetical protein
MVAQVDEKHAAMVADAVAPAGQANLFANVAVAERAAGMGTIAMHDWPVKPGPKQSRPFNSGAQAHASRGLVKRAFFSSGSRF